MELVHCKELLQVNTTLRFQPFGLSHFGLDRMDPWHAEA